MVSVVFSDVLNLSLVLPLYKKSDKFDPGNYQPIVSLETLKKITEKIAKLGWKKYLERKECCYENQFGFWSGIVTPNLTMVCSISLNGKLWTELFVDVIKAIEWTIPNC